MDFDMNVEFLRMAFWQIVMVSGPVLLVALGIEVGTLFDHVPEEAGEADKVRKGNQHAEDAVIV